MAKFFTKLACGFWNIDIPENTKSIAETGEQVADLEDLHEGRVSVRAYFGHRFHVSNFFISKLW